MPAKPNIASGYSASAAQLIQSTTLYLATKLGDLTDDLVVVGGLVPSLIIPQSKLTEGMTTHVGTLDVDLGLAIALLDDKRYSVLSERLSSAGFQPDVTEEGLPTTQRWYIESEGRRATVDFLIPPTLQGDVGGRLRNLQEGFAAIITPGLELAFRDRRSVVLTGETLSNERASRRLWVCEAGAFVVLKALAFRSRGENKDAYDLIYLLQNYGSGIGDVFERLRPIMGDESSRRALEILEADFTSVDGVGTKRYAAFLGTPEDEALLADAAGVVRSLLDLRR